MFIATTTTKSGATAKLIAGEHKTLFTAKTKLGEEAAAIKLVKTYFAPGSAAMKNLRQVRTEELHALVGDYFKSPHRNPAAQIWTIYP